MLLLGHSGQGLATARPTTPEKLQWAPCDYALLRCGSGDKQSHTREAKNWAVTDTTGAARSINSPLFAVRGCPAGAASCRKNAPLLSAREQLQGGSLCSRRKRGPKLEGQENDTIRKNSEHSKTCPRTHARTRQYSRETRSVLQRPAVTRRGFMSFWL